MATTVTDSGFGYTNTPIDLPDGNANIITVRLATAQRDAGGERKQAARPRVATEPL